MNTTIDYDFAPHHFDKLNDSTFNVNTQDKTGRTLLFIGCRICELDKITDLVKLGANPHIVDNNGHTCLTVICSVKTQSPNKLNIVKYLFEELHMDPDHVTNKCESYLNCACKNGNLEIVKYLCEKYPHLTDAVDTQGMNCLTHAINRNYYDLVQYLLSIGIDPNSFNELTGLPALAIASKEKHYEIVKLLIKHGADINETSDRGRSSLYYAVEHMSGNYDTILLLLANGATICDRSRKILTKQCNRQDILQYLQTDE